MIPATYNLPSVVRGDTANSVQFTLLSDAVPIDLTSCIIRCFLRKGSKLGSIYRQFSNNVGGITITNAVSGIFQLDQFQADFPADTYYYDIEIRFPGGVVKTYLSGTLQVLQDVTV